MGLLTKRNIHPSSFGKLSSNVDYRKKKTSSTIKPKGLDPVAVFGLFFVLAVLMIFISFIAILIGS